MRVLHVHSGNLYGGIERVLVTLACEERRRRLMEAHFALCFEGRLSEELACTFAPVHCLGNVRIRRFHSVWRSRRALRRVLASLGSCVVVCHSAWSSAIFGSVARQMHRPLVFWLHGPPRQQHWLQRWANRVRPDLVLCNSYFTCEAGRTLFKGIEREVLYCPVAPPATYSEADRSAVRAELGTGDDAVVVIQASRMESWKGQILHLEALALLKDLPGWICWQVGGVQRLQERRYFEQLVGTAAKLGLSDRVRFVGERSDVARLLAASDIYCQPNTGPEPFGVGLVEALWAGLPVVTSNIGGAREIVIDSCGMVISPRDAQTLASSLRCLIRNAGLRGRLGTAGPARARELCDPGRQIERLDELLKPFASRPEF